MHAADLDGILQVAFKDLWNQIILHDRWELLRLRLAYVDDHKQNHTQNHKQDRARKHPLNGVIQYQAPKHPPIWLQLKAYGEYDQRDQVRVLSGSLYDVSTLWQTHQKPQLIL